jgi:hypothetical protein
MYPWIDLQQAKEHILVRLQAVFNVVIWTMSHVSRCVHYKLYICRGKLTLTFVRSAVRRDITPINVPIAMFPVTAGVLTGPDVTGVMNELSSLYVYYIFYVLLYG